MTEVFTFWSRPAMIVNITLWKCQYNCRHVSLLLKRIISEKLSAHIFLSLKYFLLRKNFHPHSAWKKGSRKSSLFNFHKDPFIVAVLCSKVWQRVFAFSTSILSSILFCTGVSKVSLSFIANNKGMIVSIMLNMCFVCVLIDMVFFYRVGFPCFYSIYLLVTDWTQHHFLSKTADDNRCVVEQDARIIGVPRSASLWQLSHWRLWDRAMPSAHTVLP